MLVRHAARRAVRPAFSLMELLVVVAIIVLLASIGGYYFMGALENAKKDAASTQVKGTLTPAVDAYKIDHGTYPASLQALLARSDNGKGPYLKSAEALTDPWGRAYQYNPAGPNNNGLAPDIWAESPEGQIGNWAARR